MVIIPIARSSQQLSQAPPSGKTLFTRHYKTETTAAWAWDSSTAHQQEQACPVVKPSVPSLCLEIE
jgi:hypothetical protein